MPERPPDPPIADFIDFASDEYFMKQALHQAERAYAKEEVPVGAVIVREGKIIARSFNQVETLKDATAHAEMLALTQAEGIVEDWRLVDCDLYVTKEPCVMCAGAIMHCRLRRVIFGCADPKSGAAGGGFINLLQHPNLNHRSEVTPGILADASRDLLRSFFGVRRKSITIAENLNDSNPG
jgi:tRNA(adenine34) deaminase